MRESRVVSRESREARRTWGVVGAAVPAAQAGETPAPTEGSECGEPVSRLATVE